jgi:amino acid adenylation domain-containing protein
MSTQPGSPNLELSSSREESSFEPIHRRLERWAQTGRLALVSEHETLSYADLESRSNQIARVLLDRRIDASCPIAVCMERTPEVVTVILGVLKAGHAWLPLDPNQPRERAGHLAAQAGAGALVTHSGLFSGRALPGVLLLDLDQERQEVERQAASPLGPGPDPQEVAYCMYTSGSSGEPKCVEITRAALAAYPDALNSRFVLDGESRYLHTASFAFSSSVRQLVWPLSFGATLFLASVPLIRDPLKLLGWVKEHGVTVVDWVPSYLRQVVSAALRLPAARRQELLDNQLALELSASEPLSWSLVQQVRRDLGYRGRIANAYGLTETTGLVAWHDVEDEGGEGQVPIGRALPHAELHCLDGSLQRVAQGEEGDLWVTGRCLPRGYRDHPGAMRREPIPFSSRWPWMLATGDRGRMRADGVFEVAARSDRQVKIHGVRVDLHQAEEVLREHPAVKDASVLFDEDPVSGGRLHAFIEPRENAVTDDQDLRRFVREKYPSYLVPHQVTWCKELPRTPSLKVDRPALKASFDSGAAAGPSAASPTAPAPAPTPGRRDEVEALVRREWQAILGETEGDFFELGGDSLQAIVLLNKITTALAVEIPLVASFFGDPTVNGLVEAIVDGLAFQQPDADEMEEIEL